MKKLVLILSLVLILPASVPAAETGLLDKLKGAAQKLLGQGASGGAGTDEENGKQYIIHLTTGGKIETDNYTMEKDRVRIEIPAGAIFLDKSTVKSIEEVAGLDLEPVQTIKVQPNPTPPARPATTTRPQPKQKVPPPAPPADTTVRDDNGHDEAWWRSRIDEWKKKKAKAQRDYNKAEADWNKYNGQVSTVTAGGGSQFDITRFQDLRGAARVAMDEAQTQLDEANRMLGEALPDEARKAGAQPGWVRE